MKTLQTIDQIEETVQIAELLPAPTHPVEQLDEDEPEELKSNATEEQETLHCHNIILDSLLNELTVINFEEKAALEIGESMTRRHYLIITIEEILAAAKRNHWSLCLNEGIVYVYNGAYWNEVSKESLLHFLGNAAEKLGVNPYDARYHLFRSELLRQFFTT